MATAKTKPRLLWANTHCLLDTSSGASIAIREMLIRLVNRGFDVVIIGATHFDASSGISLVKDYLAKSRSIGSVTRYLELSDDVLSHTLVVTASNLRDRMTSAEEAVWYSLYISTLDEFRPDLVYFYGAQTLDLLIPDEAIYRGIPAIAYVANGNYRGNRWCRHVDLILTDSQATALHYIEHEGFNPVPVGTFIAPERVLANSHTRKRVLFINPVPEKGAVFVIQLALHLEKSRPDILFEVVESRGSWESIFCETMTALGIKRTSLANVVITAHTQDMRTVYGRARIILSPSMWWESAGRVLAEAMLNGIPAIITDRGGMPEMVGDGGVRVSFPVSCYHSPYNTLVDSTLVSHVANLLIRFYDDELYYAEMSVRAIEVGQQRHNIEINAQKLSALLRSLIK